MTRNIILYRIALLFCLCLSIWVSWLYLAVLLDWFTIGDGEANFINTLFLWPATSLISILPIFVMIFMKKFTKQKLLFAVALIFLIPVSFFLFSDGDFTIGSKDIIRGIQETKNYIF